MRLLCRCFGCRMHQFEPVCTRCNAHIYDGDHIEEPLFWVRLRHRMHWIRSAVVGARCEVCGRMFWRSTGSGSFPYTCSTKCDSEWMPF